MCYDVQNFDLSKGKSSFLELFHVIFILFTITKILYYHQGIFLYIEACVKTKKLKNQNYFKRPSQQLCPGLEGRGCRSRVRTTVPFRRDDKICT